jgi:hypothetical protein
MTLSTIVGTSPIRCRGAPRVIGGFAPPAREHHVGHARLLEILIRTKTPRTVARRTQPMLYSYSQ